MIDQFDWAHLEHAYGPAIDTPGHLTALSGGDESERRAAITHLDVAVLHQGFPETATAPVARVVGYLIATNAVDADIRDELVEFLGAVAEATRTLRDHPYFAPLIPELEASVIEAHRGVAVLLDDDAPALRMRAADTLVKQLQLPHLAAERPALAARLQHWATRPDDGSRQVWVRLLGELGQDVADFLDDPDPAVRIRAALAPSCRHNARATALIIAALGQPLPAGASRGEVVEAAIARSDTFDRIAEPAATIARQTSWTGCDVDWGPLLSFAFPTPHVPDAPLSPAQRMFLHALADNDQLWDPRNGSVALCFTQVGLPHDRRRCAQIAAAGG
ncbi:hypothetical protein [Streptosporangium sp. H16]|uniref:hypothetical protein n=1 Tax=Streptosporangium sp. H16 TaxID=3444184 RepID=UPI003F793AA1